MSPLSREGKRKAFGQHFLRDTQLATLIAETAVQEACAARCKALLEIGPGKGAITLPLAAALSTATGAPAHFILAEKDFNLGADWQHWARSAPVKTRVEIADFLDLAEDRWLDRTPLAVASNLPYSSGTAILTRLARHPARIPVMVLMFQAEVARRLRAEPDTKAWGSLSIWIQNRWEVTKLANVPPGAFVPPPKVDSEVVMLKPRASALIAVTQNEEKDWNDLLHAAFAHRRKMLRSGLTPRWREVLARTDIDPTKRAEALGWDDWAKLFGAR